MFKEHIVNQPKLSTVPQLLFGAGRVSDPVLIGDRWYYLDSEGAHLLSPWETYVSGELPIINGGAIAFNHGWSNFNPLTDWFEVTGYAKCLGSQQGWQPGEIMQLASRRFGIEVTATQFIARPAANRIIGIKKNGDLKEFSLDSSRWNLFIKAKREVE